jgi:hypothetical protein
LEVVSDGEKKSGKDSEEEKPFRESSEEKLSEGEEVK